MADDLITATEFKSYAGISVSTYDALIGELIDYVTAAIEKYTGRTWTTTEFTEFLDGGSRNLIANNLPISFISRILDAFDGNEEIVGDELVTNGDFATDSDWTKGTGWTIAGGLGVATTSTASLSQAGILTLGSIYRVTYTVSGLSGGTVAAKLGTLALTTRIADGTYIENGSCIGNTDFSIDALTSLTANIDIASVVKLDYTFEPATGLIYEAPDATTLQIPSERGILWGRGKRRYKVTYTAGIAGATKDVKLAALISVEDAFLHRDKSLESERIGRYSYKRKAPASGQSEWLTDDAIALLSSYVVLAI